MASVYLASVTGNGAAPSTAYRASGFDGIDNTIFMLDVVRGKCLVISSNDTVTATGTTNLVTAASFTALRVFAATTSPSVVTRTAIGAWLSGANLTPLTAAQVTWQDCIEFVARQVNSVASLALTNIT